MGEGNVRGGMGEGEWEIEGQSALRGDSRYGAVEVMRGEK